ncbi:hypothetical protein BDW59DRAFT_140023 [Aspergillus cavernicola]|uniref:Secreted protein n=1 Tax=Aspergillus cavernicola TaxID=176166 RepID=A0ABR4IVJ5_9EURO
MHFSELTAIHNLVLCTLVYPCPTHPYYSYYRHQTKSTYIMADPQHITEPSRTRVPHHRDDRPGNKPVGSVRI